MKKRNEDNQNIREDNSEELSADALEFINRLLERLHQADFTNHGSKIEFVYVASGGQHVETQINIGAPLALTKGGKKEQRPKIRSVPKRHCRLCSVKTIMKS